MSLGNTCHVCNPKTPSPPPMETRKTLLMTPRFHGLKIDDTFWHPMTPASQGFHQNKLYGYGLWIREVSPTPKKKLAIRWFGNPPFNDFRYQRNFWWGFLRETNRITCVVGGGQSTYSPPSRHIPTPPELAGLMIRAAMKTHWFPEKQGRLSNPYQTFHGVRGVRGGKKLISQKLVYGIPMFKPKQCVSWHTQKCFPAAKK